MFLFAEVRSLDHPPHVFNSAISEIGAPLETLTIFAARAPDLSFRRR
jgi:hypothetical protein